MLGLDVEAKRTKRSFVSCNQKLCSLTRSFASRFKRRFPRKSIMLVPGPNKTSYSHYLDFANKTIETGSAGPAKLDIRVNHQERENEGGGGRYDISP